MIPRAPAEVRALAAAGRPLLPLRPGGKEPALPDWPHRASTDPAHLDCWAHRLGNWGMVTGSPSGVVVVDADSREAFDGLCARGIGSPHVVRTPNGYHLYYHAPAEPLANSVGRIAPHVDVRADGGYAVVPPSEVGGVRYTPWEVTAGEGPGWPLGEMPEWMRAAARRGSEPAAVPAPTVPTGPGGTTTPRRVSAGRRNDWLTQCGGALRRQGVEAAGLRGALAAVNISQCDPPLAAGEVERIAGSVARYRGPLYLPEIDLWPEPVDGARLLSGLVTEARRYVIMTAEQADAVVLWAVLAHEIDGARIAPKLAITSPTKGCGKTTLLSVLHALVPRPLIAANLTPAVLYRAIEAAQPTLLVDEADTFLGANSELRGILNSGHTRTAANVYRCVGEDHEPRRFSTWCPQVIAKIGGLPGTLADRSVGVRLERAPHGERPPHLDPAGEARLAELARKVARWATDHPITDVAPAPPAELHHRAADNWEPLLAIADLAGGEWPERARRAAIKLSGGEPSPDVKVLLLGDMRDAMAGRKQVTTTELLGILHCMDHRPWAEWRARPGDAPGPITAPQLAHALSDFQVGPTTIRTGAATAKGYRASDLTDSWASYLPPLPAPGETVDLLNFS
ncbi:MAG: DUF3631 domain-containing protein [Terriglobales bacterium]